MTERNKLRLTGVDALLLIFLVGLALLPPITEIHKQFILALFFIFQLIERELMEWHAVRGAAISVLLKIVLATVLLDHTGGLGINSSYYPIFYVPVITAALYFRPLGTLLWTALASLAYCSYLIPALREYELTAMGVSYLATRILFFFFAAVLVNQFAMKNRAQVQLLEESNRQLRQAQEEARRAERLAALGQLSAGLAHEIRNPLGVIKGSAEMLNEKLKGSNPLAVELASYISSEVNRLNGLVARFLDFARPSQLQLHDVDVPAVVDRALAAVQSHTQADHVEVQKHYAAKVPAIIADEQLCEQVFVNLIQNAFDAIGEHGGKLELNIDPIGSDEENGIIVRVQDSGPGVPAELREQIFNPFFTSKPSGVGLGLAIVAKIVADHRGSIHLEERDAGACFRVFLPAHGSER